MKNFCEYVSRRNTPVSKYDLPHHFMSFQECKWESHGDKNPNGIILFPISTTLGHWRGNRFGLYEGDQTKVQIIKITNAVADYTMESFNEDVEKLRMIYADKFEPNQNLIAEFKELSTKAGGSSSYDALIEQERNKFNYILAESTKQASKPSQRLWLLTQWIANNGKNPEAKFTGNAPQRWTNVFKNLDYDGFVFENIALFFDSNELEPVDEISIERST